MQCVTILSLRKVGNLVPKIVGILHMWKEEAQTGESKGLEKGRFQPQSSKKVGLKLEKMGMTTCPSPMLMGMGWILGLLVISGLGRLIN